MVATIHSTGAGSASRSQFSLPRSRRHGAGIASVSNVWMLRKLRRSRRTWRFLSTTIAKVPRHDRGLSRHRLDPCIACARVQPIKPTLHALICAIHGAAALSIFAQPTHCAGESAAERADAELVRCGAHVWIRRSEPFHPDLRSVRRSQSRKVASAPTQLGYARGPAPNAAKDFTPRLIWSFHAKRDRLVQ